MIHCKVFMALLM